MESPIKTDTLIGRKKSDKKYRDANKQILADKHKEYMENNKDKTTVYNKKYYTENKEILCSKIECECGVMVSKKNKARHFKSLIHLAFEKGVNSTA